MTDVAWVPMPFVKTFLATVSGPLELFLPTSTAPWLAVADFHFSSVRLRVEPSAMSRVGSIQSAQSQLVSPRSETIR